MQTEAVEKIVIEAISAAVASQGARVMRDTEVLRVVDSLGLWVALANIQAELGISLEPEQLIEVFQARSIADIARIVESTCSPRVTASP